VEALAADLRARPDGEHKRLVRRFLEPPRQRLCLAVIHRGAGANGAGIPGGRHHRLFRSI
jgi:hypothetical protein